MLQDFAGKTALITGGATGIGRALGLALARRGMNVVLASTNADRLNATAAEIGALGVRVTPIVCDVSDRAAVRALGDQATTAHGAIDLLCANAGVTTAGPLLDHTPADWDWVYGVVLHGVVNCIQTFYPPMAQRRSGQILITGSQTALAPDWVLGHGPYVSAKAALVGLATALRPEAAEHNVGVSLLNPAATETDIMLGARSRPARHAPGAAGTMALRPGAPTPLPHAPFMLSAEEVANRAISGLERNAEFIATHAGMKPVVEDFFARILAAYDQAAAWGEV
jgi:NAD(P)-dependent dehydrogenase (short-subunit alcohol dehydrogenase family)